MKFSLKLANRFSFLDEEPSFSTNPLLTKVSTPITKDINIDLRFISVHFIRPASVAVFHMTSKELQPQFKG